MDDPNPNKRVYLQIYDYETKEFSGLTTYHGLVRIYNSNTWPSRIFWSVVVLSCLSLFMIHSGYLLLGYHSKPTLFQINTIVPDNGLKFPDITICNLNPIDLEKVKFFNISTDFLHYLLDFYRDINNPPLGLYLNRNLEFAGKKFNVSKFMESVGKSCEKSIISCSFGGAPIPNCCRMMENVLTDFGPCFRLSSNFRQFYSGDNFGFEFVMDGQNFGGIDLPTYPERGFLLVVHEPGKLPKVDANAVAVPPHAHLHSSISVKNISLLERQNWGVCQKTWPKTPHFSWNYTSSHCEKECQMNRTLTLCQCVPFSLIAPFSAGELEICRPEQLEHCAELLRKNYKTSCSCDSECDFLEFELSSSYSSISRRMSKKLGLSEEYVQVHVSAASVFLRHVAYERHEQQKQLQTADLLSNIAGSMGLFLGMSTVTLLEIFIYLFKSVWGTVNSSRQQQFMEAVAEEERERQQSVLIIENDDKDEEQFEDVDEPRQTGRHSNTPIHIHLDRRNSRMLVGGDLFSAPRGSVSIPSQLLSPLSKHRKSISIASLAQQDGEFLTIGAENGEISVGNRRINQIRRSSTLSFTRKARNDSTESDIPLYPKRKASTQSNVRMQLI